MSAGTYNLVIEQGATFIRVFLWQVGGTTDCSCTTTSTTAVPVDLTGFSADLQIRQTPQSTTILYEGSTANGNIVLGGTAGTITLTIPSTTTAGFSWLRGVYDLILTSSGGIVTRLLQGSVTVSPDVTR